MKRRPSCEGRVGQSEGRVVTLSAVCGFGNTLTSEACKAMGVPREQLLTKNALLPPLQSWLVELRQADPKGVKRVLRLGAFRASRLEREPNVAPDVTTRNKDPTNVARNY